MAFNGLHHHDGPSPVYNFTHTIAWETANPDPIEFAEIEERAEKRLRDLYPGREIVKVRKVEPKLRGGAGYVRALPVPFSPVLRLVLV